MFKTRNLKTPSMLLILLPLLFWAPVVQAESEKFYLQVGIEYASGDYGTGSSSQTVTIPFTLGYAATDRLGFQLEVPYIFQEESTTVFLRGRQLPFRRGDGDATSGRRRDFDQEDSRNGLGDIALTTGYTLLTEQRTVPQVRGLLYIKFPTGDEEEGLGTGEFDWGAGAGLTKWVGDWSAYLEGMYVVTGSSSEFELENYWTWMASLDYLLSPRLRAGAALSGATEAFEGADDALEAQIRADYLLTDRWGVGSYLLFGLADGSPDFGAGVSAFVSF